MRLVAVCLLLAACPSPTDDDPVETDSDTDVVETCDDYEQTVFEALELEALCAHVVTCPDSAYATVENCMIAEKSLYDQTGCWDACEARDCMAWVAQQDHCPTATEFDPVCDSYWRCE